MSTVNIDREDCTSCAQCWTTCPDVFEENPDDNFSQIIDDFRVEGNIAEGLIPDMMAGCAHDAADGCPAQIIHVSD